jgi:uncharacterized membrane protein
MIKKSFSSDDVADPSPVGRVSDRFNAVESDAATTLELRPNCSLSPLTASLFFAIIATNSLLIAAFFAFRGFWPVLPFAGLELALLGWALRDGLRRRSQVQVITIGPSEVRIFSGQPGLCGEMVFSRHWARVTLRRPRAWLPLRLWIESHGRRCEIGAFLTEEERVELGRRLRALLDIGGMRSAGGGGVAIDATGISDDS